MLRKSSHLNNTLKVHKNKYFCQLLRVLLSSTLLFIFWHHYLKVSQGMQMSECSEQLSWWFVWGDTIPCLVLKLGRHVWSGRGLGHRISNDEIQLMFKGKAYSQNAPRRPLWKKRHYERKQWKSCVTNSCDFPSYASKFRQDQKYRLSQHYLPASSFLSSWCWCARESKSGLPAFLRSLGLKSLQGQNSCQVTGLNP